jgi:hypothetical protein
MAVQAKSTTSDDIINGLAVICPGRAKGTWKYDPGASLAQHVPSGDSLKYFQVLDGRFHVGPSGWSS